MANLCKPFTAYDFHVRYDKTNCRLRNTAPVILLPGIAEMYWRSRYKLLSFFQPQPAEEKLTPADDKFEGDILLTPEEEKAINDADKNIPQLRSDDDNSNDVS